MGWYGKIEIITQNFTSTERTDTGIPRVGAIITLFIDFQYMFLKF